MSPNRRDRSRERTLSASQQEEFVRAKRAARWVGLIVPLTLLTVALILVLVWIPRMPNPAATHWSGSSGPDGFGSPWTYVWMLLLAGHGLVLMMWGFIVLGSRGHAPSPKRVMPVWGGYQRFLAAFSAGFAVFMAFTMLASVVVQLDVADAGDAGAIGGWIALGFGLWLLVMVLVWFVQPRVEIARASEGPSEPLPLARSERAVWLGEIRPSKTFIWIMGVTLLVLTGSAVLVFASPAPLGMGLLMLAVVLLAVVLAVTGSWFRVRIDEAGLEARSIVGWPVFRLPADEVSSVEAAQINPFAEFGGWGLRWGPGQFGIVMRTGEGVVAKRRDGRVFAVTVDDARTAASVLAAAAERAGERKGRA